MVLILRQSAAGVTPWQDVDKHPADAIHGWIARESSMRCLIGGAESGAPPSQGQACAGLGELKMSRTALFQQLN
jgi:hypothetical protein